MLDFFYKNPPAQSLRRGINNKVGYEMEVSILNLG